MDASTMYERLYNFNVIYVHGNIMFKSMDHFVCTAFRNNKTKL